MLDHTNLMASDSTHERLRDRYDHLVGGTWREPADGGYFETENPATERSLTSAAAGTEPDVDRAVETATDAFPAWRDTDPVTRGRRVGAVADRIRSRLDELAAIESLDQGKPLSQAKAELSATPP